MSIHLGDIVAIGLDKHGTTCGAGRADEVVSWKKIGSVHKMRDNGDVFVDGATALDELLPPATTKTAFDPKALRVIGGRTR